MVSRAMTEICKTKRTKFIPLPPYERVRELFNYDPATGALTWRVSRGPAVAGQPVGCLDGKGYWVGGIDGKVYRLHRIIWLWMTGNDPVVEIDHRNRRQADNIWGNLRLATSSQNQANRGVSVNNTSGLKNISLNRGRWVVQIN